MREARAPPATDCHLASGGLRGGRIGRPPRLFSGMDAIPAKAAPLAEQLVALGTCLHVILAHMEGWEAEHGSRDDGATVAQILGDLLATVLAPYARRNPADIAVAARILADVTAVVEGELFVVSSPDR